MIYAVILAAGILIGHFWGTKIWPAIKAHFAPSPAPTPVPPPVVKS